MASGQVSKNDLAELNDRIARFVEQARIELQVDEPN